MQSLPQKTMGTIKTFLLGMGTAYAIYYLTKKRPDGSSLLEDMLDNPALYLKKAKRELLADAVETVSQKLA